MSKYFIIVLMILTPGIASASILPWECRAPLSMVYGGILFLSLGLQLMLLVQLAIFWKQKNRIKRIKTLLLAFMVATTALIFVELYHDVIKGYSNWVEGRDIFHHLALLRLKAQPMPAEFVLFATLLFGWLCIKHKDELHSKYTLPISVMIIFQASIVGIYSYLIVQAGVLPFLPICSSSVLH